MKSLSPVETSNAQSSASELNIESWTLGVGCSHRSLHFLRLFLLLLIFYSASQLHAQVGNNNATGVSGILVVRSTLGAATIRSLGTLPDR